MQERVQLSVSVDRNWIGDWRAVTLSLLAPLAPDGIAEYPFGYEFSFGHYPENLEKRIHATVSVSRSFSERELMKSEFLLLETTQELSTKPDTLRKACRMFCTHCGFEEPIYDLSHLQIARKPKGNELALADSSVRIVSHGLAAALTKAGLAGLQLTPLGGADEWWNIDSNHILPPLKVPPTRIRWTNRRTPRCLPNHAFYSRPDSQMFYGVEQFNAVEVNATYEHYGASCHGARSLIIANRVYQLLVALEVRGFRCEPIGLADSLITQP